MREPLAVLTGEKLAHGVALVAFLNGIIVGNSGGCVGLHRSLIVGCRAAAGDVLEVLDLLEGRADLAKHGAAPQSLHREVYQRHHVRPLEEREDDGGEVMRNLAGHVVADVAHAAEGAW